MIGINILQLLIQHKFLYILKEITLKTHSSHDEIDTSHDEMHQNCI